MRELEIRQLTTDLLNERKAHEQTRQGLNYAQCEVEVLRGKIADIQQKAQELLGGIALDDVPSETEKVFVELVRHRHRRTFEGATDQTLVTIALSDEEISTLDYSLDRRGLSMDKIWVWEGIRKKLKNSMAESVSLSTPAS
jgi:hypothetical protein